MILVILLIKQIGDYFRFAHKQVRWNDYYSFKNGVYLLYTNQFNDKMLEKEINIKE